MSEFKRVPNPVFPPRSCALCNSFEGPMVDTELDVVGHGRLYICLATERRAGCVAQFARLDDLVSGELLRDERLVRAKLQARIDDLERRTMQVVPLEEVMQALAAGAPTSGADFLAEALSADDK